MCHPQCLSFSQEVSISQSKSHYWIIYGYIVSCTHNNAINHQNDPYENCFIKEYLLTICSRYLIVVVNSTKNPHRSAVAKDINDTILKWWATKGVSVLYWSKEEQENRLITAFEKWKTVQGVWSAAATSVSIQPKPGVSCNSMMSRSMSNNCTTYKKVALLEPDAISPQMEVALKAHTRDGIRSRGHLRVVLKSFVP